MLYGTGMTCEDMDKGQVGIASVWYDGNTGNRHLNKLAERVKQGVIEAGICGRRRYIIGVSDGIKLALKSLAR